MALPQVATNTLYTWTGTGTGAMTLSTAASGFQTLGAAHDGLRFVYESINAGSITNGLSSERELGWGTWTNSTTTLNRATGPGSATTDGVIYGTNGTSLVNFSSGTKYVSITLTGELLDALLLAKAAGGDTLSDVVLEDYAETSPVATGVSGAVTRDFTAGQVQHLTLSGNVTSLTISNPPASGQAGSITLIVNLGAGPYTWAHPSNTDWADATAPTLGTGVNVLTYITRDGGSNWWGFYGGGAFA